MKVKEELVAHNYIESITKQSLIDPSKRVVVGWKLLCPLCGKEQPRFNDRGKYISTCYCGLHITVQANSLTCEIDEQDLKKFRGNQK